jgi:hypothetical protein
MAGVTPEEVTFFHWIDTSASHEINLLPQRQILRF